MTWTPNIKHALAVHYDVPDEEAQKEFERRGYRGIRNFKKDDSGPMGCEEARRVARNRAETNEEGCYEYQGHEFFGEASVARCRIYQFDFDQYVGKRNDGVHKRDCRNT